MGEQEHLSAPLEPCETEPGDHPGEKKNHRDEMLGHSPTWEEASFRGVSGLKSISSQTLLRPCSHAAHRFAKQASSFIKQTNTHKNQAAIYTLFSGVTIFSK